MTRSVRGASCAVVPIDNKKIADRKTPALIVYPVQRTIVGTMVALMFLATEDNRSNSLFGKRLLKLFHPGQQTLARDLLFVNV
jgi:hypothetical protein